ncbi:NAD(P)H-dependent oxidoreductase subunit E [Roseospira marina]|uniref:NAD(P)H-dependent oxidoreductase subunit E n=1 Tax=Roseospira marina TaxID=140057 RepID=A0A5M6I923_9PROT|nr:NAD(P)H-dependent oxidoreductase subunit E [Roseospira marina]KAA5604760.1 NAD(P)H-dependent oxidoreductase subunit E [Roseospira marina]MBB4313440.1 NADH-quinone oxidoreductase E subunit [Roseospira marina]MBB5086602.1 NADH-quinone oxidoreductase E subunit [Roseospira marina]
MSAETTPTAPARDETPFAFSEASLEEARRILAKYPEGRARSGILPLLDLAQRQHGWVSQSVVEAVAEMTGAPPIRVWEVATFYTMYNKAPIGRAHVEICTNLPCWLRGSDEIMRAARDVFGVGFGETSADGAATVSSAECLGACVNAPMVQIGDDYYEDLDYDSAVALFTAIKEGRPVKAGSQIDRQCSAPQGTPTSLTTDPTTDEGGRWIAPESPAASSGTA